MWRSRVGPGHNLPEALAHSLGPLLGYRGLNPKGYKGLKPVRVQGANAAALLCGGRGHNLPLYTTYV
jgi:hypothetical protein